MLGKDIDGGDTLYYDGGTSFRKRDPAGTRGKLVQTVPFKHGRYQVGEFEKVVHAGGQWEGQRGIISFYLNQDIYKFFMGGPDAEMTTEAAQAITMQ